MGVAVASAWWAVGGPARVCNAGVCLDGGAGVEREALDLVTDQLDQVIHLLG